MTNNKRKRLHEMLRVYNYSTTAIRKEMLAELNAELFGALVMDPYINYGSKGRDADTHVDHDACLIIEILPTLDVKVFSPRLKLERRPYTRRSCAWLKSVLKNTFDVNVYTKK